MGKKIKEPARPYYSVKHEFTDAQKAFEEAAMALFNAADTILLHWRDKLPDPAAKILDEKCKMFRAAAFSDE